MLATTATGTVRVLVLAPIPTACRHYIACTQFIIDGRRARTIGQMATPTIVLHVHNWGVQLAPFTVCKHGGVDETPIRGVLVWPYLKGVC